MAVQVPDFALVMILLVAAPYAASENFLDGSDYEGNSPLSGWAIESHRTDGPLWAIGRGMPCLGLSDWPYHLGPYTALEEPAPFIEEAISLAWRVPREAEEGYVDPNQFEAMLKNISSKRGE